MPKRPNILIFMTDHQRGDTVLSEHPARTPNVERLAREGVTFSETFCPSPHCCPARATFFSGLYPSRHGVWNNICNGQRLSRGLKPGVKLFSDYLAPADYRCVFAGKWHVSIDEGPADHGWEERMASAAGEAHHGTTWERWQQLAESADDLTATRGEGEILRPGWGVYRLYGTQPREKMGHDNRMIETAESALSELLAGDRPWCLFAGAIGPHDPYFVPQEYLDLYDIEDVPLPPSYADEMSDKPRVVQRMRRQLWDQLSEREVREGIRHFWAYCTYLDDLFGRLLDRLDRSGQRDNTLVLYTSDHGDYCGDHGLFAKGIPCYRGAYHVPAVVRWPARIPTPGRRVDAPVSLADFAPTFLDAAGLTADQRFTGQSLVPFLDGSVPASWRDAVFTQCNGVELYYSQRSVATRHWKYVFNGFDEDELYDLQDDPHEIHNRAGDPGLTEVRRNLMRQLWRFARDEDDSMVNGYITVGLAPWGPAEAFR
ncbi:MAG: sulfatase-like hydrolase/transferase [Kiritimatiellaeota bacterium]|nr:sulfatase-like hydrolase/transferase [Kiritimatiellota bacterium]